MRRTLWGPANIATAVGYRLRRLVKKPAPPMRRCTMGSVVDPRLHCPRYVVAHTLLCARHI